MFTLGDKSGALQSALSHFGNHGVTLTRIESRPSKKSADVEFYVDFQGDAESKEVEALLVDLRQEARQVDVLLPKRVTWFPRRKRDLDIVANNTLDAGEDLESDHPGFNDPVYRERRAELARLAREYRFARKQALPDVVYTQDEINTWSAVWDKLTPLLRKHACKEHVRMLPHLMDNCGYGRYSIPQLSSISDFLKDCTGFTIRPVAGLLSSRDFLYGLAFRVFFSTQYIRHHSKPLYTPEPDICHELLGHVPLFADQAFADFSQEIGLAAIGATDEQVEQLARCYWFSVEFGLTEEDGERKAYGAGLLSSFGELEYSMSSEPEFRKWDPFSAAQQTYPITTYQPIYYVAESFADAKKQLTEFSASFARPFNVRYNPYCESIETDANVLVDNLPAGAR